MASARLRMGAAAVVVDHAQPKPPRSSVSAVSTTKTFALVLGALVYFIFFLTHTLAEENANRPVSQPLLWTVFLSASIMITRKLLKTSGFAESTDAQADSNTSSEATEDCANDGGSGVLLGTITIVGDVCIYVLGVLAFCYVLLPWMVNVNDHLD